MGRERGLVEPSEVRSLSPTLPSCLGGDDLCIGPVESGWVTE